MSKYMRLEFIGEGSVFNIKLFALNPFPSPTEMAIKWRIEFPDYLRPTERARFEGDRTRVNDGAELGRWLVARIGMPSPYLAPIKVTAWVTNAIPDELTVSVDQIPAG
jgi:hypothetical protein